jgi:hypothetical protein
MRDLQHGYLPDTPLCCRSNRANSPFFFAAPSWSIGPIDAAVAFATGSGTFETLRTLLASEAQ